MVHRSLFIQFGIACFVSVCSVSVHAAIPVSHIKGIDELFSSKYKVYSPLIGLNQEDDSIQSLYNLEPTESRPEVKLVQMLFSAVPGGEVFPTHLAKNPGAHLNPSLIAKLFHEFELMKASDLTKSEFVGTLSDKLLRRITSDVKYQESISAAQQVALEAELEKEAVNRSSEEAARQSEVAEEFRNLNITPLDRKIKKLRIQGKQDADSVRTELETLTQVRDSLTKQYEELRKVIPKHGKRQRDKDRLIYLVETNDVNSEEYKLRLVDLTTSLSESFYLYERNPNLSYPGSSVTRSILLRYLWSKYLNKADLKDYLEEMVLLGAIQAKDWSRLGDAFFQDYYTAEEYIQFKSKFWKSIFKKRWVRRHLPKAVALVHDTAPGKAVPPIVPFGYLRWITYSDFPDCGENALHNVFNLITFNSKKGIFDFELLEKLKSSYYPGLSDKLIMFYRSYPGPAQHDSNLIANEWIQLVSDLNQGIEELELEKKVHYLRDRRTHLYGKYGNLIKVVNRLFGYEDLCKDNMSEILSKVKEVSGLEIFYQGDGVDNEGFGTALFHVDSHVFKLNSYRPFHVTYKYHEDTNDKILRKLKSFIGRK